MYEVWFMDCEGHWMLDEAFESLEEAEAYVDELWDDLSYEEYMEIREV
jgi:hypothetical protein